MISEAARDALQHDQTIDITTTGRRSGSPRRLEIWFHNIDGRIYLTGLPGRRDWYANLLAQPEFTLHVKQSTQADIRSRAYPVTDPAERERVLRTLLTGIGRREALGDWIDHSPLVEVRLLDE